MTNRGGETITYDVFNKPLTINGSNGTSSFSYGPNHERFKQVSGGKAIYVINSGAYEEIIDSATGSITQKSYVDGFMAQAKTGSTIEVTYLHKDHLGSTEAMTDANGNLTGRMSFDVWGNRQQADWQAGTPSTAELNSFKTQKGYTGHEQLDTHHLVHMGGRVYDPTIGRFLSADLYIQSPYNTQSFNRYSYVFNNPLSRIDPTGYFSDMMQWAMESSYQHASGWFWNASYQAAQAQINYSQAKKAAERAANQGTPTVWMEELPRDKKEELQSTSKQKNGNGLGFDNAQEDTIPSYDPSDPNYHEYVYDRAICTSSFNSNCTVSNVQYGSRLYPVPLAKGDVAVTTGDVSNAQIGLVRHVVDNETNTVVNITLSGKHMLDPGKVVRTVYQKGSVVFNSYKKSICSKR